MAETEREEESKHDPETTPSTPESGVEAQSELKAPKDRNCPFCGQAFTSSSLGRHLDLYIKSKNPKPPDGVHDVEEIKKLRGGITRRQARSSVKTESDKKDENQKKGNSAPGSSTKSRYEESKGTIGNFAKDSRDVNDGKLHTWLNAANWQATGVINDLPARASSRSMERPVSSQPQRAFETRHDAASNRISRSENVSADDMQKLQETAEVGKAAEMALREVLGSLEAAKKRAEPKKLFDDFDFCSLAFPGLCLAILPPPPTLFSSTPFPVAHTWSLPPPGESQRATLVRLLHARVATVRNGNPDNVPESVIFQHRVHLDGAFEHWQTLSDSERATAWNLEVCRAFVLERDKKQHLKDELEVAEQRIRHLEAEYDRLSRCQLPREYLLHPPNTIPMAPSTTREMKATDMKSGVAQFDYDADALLNKWRTEVKAVARPLKPPLQPHYVETTRNELKGDYLLNGSVFGVNGPMPRDTDTVVRMNNPEKAIRGPRNLGGIVGSDDDAEVEDVVLGGGDESDAPGSDDESDSRALTKRQSARRIGNNEVGNSPLNEHGKRPLGPSIVNGRSSGPKMYKEQLK